jgi:ADP-ribosylglycohydrolase
MIRRERVLLMLPIVVLLGVRLAAWAVKPPISEFRAISLDELRDKIQGGWAGQMIGVSYGAPTEFRYPAQIIPEDKLPVWKPDRILNSLEQDDLYVDMTFAKVIDEKGLDATTEDFGVRFKDARYPLWHANLAARRALKRGVPAGASGTPAYNAHANDIDFQIESDFIGLMSPGLPQFSNAVANRAGRVMNYGDGVYGGMFVSAMYGAGFFETDPRKVIEAGVAAIPSGSPYAQIIRDVLQLSRENPSDWIKVWNSIEQKWDKNEPCPEGALKPFNIDAKLNGAYIALGLLYGERDFQKTMSIATRCGQDSDCNPSSAVGILGVMRGYRAIPDPLKKGIPEIADRKFEYTDYSFKTIVTSTYDHALEAVKRNGGKVDGDRLLVKLQQPKPPKLELWDNFGSPEERIAVSDSQWAWRGDWRTGNDKWAGLSHPKVSETRGAEASIAFEGTGAIVTGFYLPNGGRADVYLDGKLNRTVDVYPDEDNVKGGEDIWHVFGLKQQQHSVRVVVKGEPYPGSSGRQVALSDIVVFR